MRELFIYYRVDPVHAPALRTAIDRWHARLRADHPGLVARLLVKADETPGGMETWMETYATDAQRQPGGIDADLETRIAADAAALLAPWIEGERHVEVFRACAS